MTTLITELEGSLIDPGPGYCHALKVVLNDAGYPIPACLEHTWPTQLPVDETLERLIPDCDDKRRRSLMMRWADCYLSEGIAHNRVYPGVDAGLATLRMAGWSIEVVTQRQRGIAEQMADDGHILSLIDRLHAPTINHCCRVRRAAVALLVQSKPDSAPITWLSDDPMDLHLADKLKVKSAFASYGRSPWRYLRNTRPLLIKSPHFLAQRLLGEQRMASSAPDLPITWPMDGLTAASVH